MYKSTSRLVQLLCVSPSFRAMSYYKRAAEKGDKRATQRLKNSQNGPMHQPGGPGSVLHRGEGDSDTGKTLKDKDCVIM